MLDREHKTIYELRVHKFSQISNRNRCTHARNENDNVGMGGGLRIRTLYVILCVNALCALHTSTTCLRHRTKKRPTEKPRSKSENSTDSLKRTPNTSRHSIHRSCRRMCSTTRLSYTVTVKS